MKQKKCNLLIVQMSLDIGGAETHIVELALELNRRGYHVVVASNGGAYVSELTQAGIIHYKVPLQNKNPKNMITSYHLLKSIMRDEKIDLVHAHARIPAFIVGKLCKKMRIPFVTTAHWVFTTAFGLKYLTNWGDRTVAVSEDIKQYLIDNYGIPAENITVTINGIDTKRFSAQVDYSDIAKEFSLMERAFRIVHISRIDRSREAVAFLLAKAMPEIFQKIPEAELVIVGAGDMFEELRQEVKRINLQIGREAVKLAGARTDINKFTACANLFVGASRAALEAMAAGKATVVAGNEGDMGLFGPDKKELAFANNFTCRGAKLPTQGSIVDSICMFYDMSEDEKKRVAEYCQKTVYENYSVEKMTDDTETAYRAAMKK